MEQATPSPLRVEHAVALTLAETAGSAETYPNVLAAIGETLGWPVGAVWERMPGGEKLRCVEVWQAGNERFDEFRPLSERLELGSGEGLPGRVWEQGEPIWLCDVPTEPNFPRAAAATEAGFHAAFCFPIRSGGAILGAMEFFSRDPSEPDEELLASVAVLGSLIGQFVVRRQAEDAVRESEARNRAILDAALDAVITMNDRGEIVEFNRAAEQMFGHAAEDAVGCDMAELIVPPSLRESHRLGLARYLVTEQPAILDRRVEITGLRADGTEFPVELTITRIGVAGPPLFTGYIRDITDRRWAEAELRASRVRIVEAGDRERRRIERNLHDGAQQHLVSLALRLRGASECLEDEPDAARGLLEQADLELAVALAELRELAQGIHPAVLADRGLRPALEGLASRSTLRVEIASLPADRLPEPVEVAAYYFVAEALANALKHADATVVTVRVELDGRRVVLGVVDDGVGGAGETDGTGLRGLIDRIEALGGRFSVDSPAGGGTRLRAEIPLHTVE
ncbi:MAG TPA: PAS domain S-box protein [Gaiellaceae bacterium]|nr:PAS domain S-box protein [Gaiellaceae bacterium]